jgi:hypothetical protein
MMDLITMVDVIPHDGEEKENCFDAFERIS